MNRIAVAQLGARMHYAVPRILHNGGQLHRLYTDICASTGFPSSLHWIPKRLRPGPLERLLDRVPHGVPPERITTFPRFGMQYAYRLARAQSAGETTAAYLWAGQAFGKRIGENGLSAADAVYAFNTAAHQVFKYARERGMRTVVEQTIAPRKERQRLLDREHERFPEWQDSPSADPFHDEHVAREKAEWKLADLIVCGSTYVRDCIGTCGGPVERCVVVPYGVEIGLQPSRSNVRDRPLRVLTVGAVGLRKGSPYVLEAARRCSALAEFRMVGSVGVSDTARERLEEHVEVVGHVPRSVIARHYEWADVFLLPSLCEGSATVTYEALAAGLPVICTPHTRSIVRDGQDGFVVPVRDPAVITARLRELASAPDQYQRMARNARERFEEMGSLSAYASRLSAALQE